MSQQSIQLGNVLILDAPHKDVIKTAAYLKCRLMWATASAKAETFYTTTEAVDDLVETYPQLITDCVDHIIPNKELTKAKLTFARLDNKIAKWAMHTAVMLTCQHHNQPEGVELIIHGLKINLSFAGFARDED